MAQGLLSALREMVFIHEDCSLLTSITKLKDNTTRFFFKEKELKVAGYAKSLGTRKSLPERSRTTPAVKKPDLS